MKYDVTIFDFDRNEQPMTDGDHYEVESMSATEAVLSLVRKLADYEEGTVGRRDYLSLKEIECIDEDITTSAYRLDDASWEVHIYTSSIDEAFTFQI